MADERLVRRFSRLKMTAGTSVINYIDRPCKPFPENVLIRADVVFSALETFCLMGYISLLTYLLSYLLTYMLRYSAAREM